MKLDHSHVRKLKVNAGSDNMLSVEMNCLTDDNLSVEYSEGDDNVDSIFNQFRDLKRVQEEQGKLLSSQGKLLSSLTHALAPAHILNLSHKILNQHPTTMSAFIHVSSRVNTPEIKRFSSSSIEICDEIPEEIGKTDHQNGGRDQGQELNHHCQNEAEDEDDISEEQRENNRLWQEHDKRLLPEHDKRVLRLKREMKQDRLWEEHNLVLIQERYEMSLMN